MIGVSSGFTEKLAKEVHDVVTVFCDHVVEELYDKGYWKAAYITCKLIAANKIFKALEEALEELP